MHTWRTRAQAGGTGAQAETSRRGFLRRAGITGAVAAGLLGVADVAGVSPAFAGRASIYVKLKHGDYALKNGKYVFLGHGAVPTKCPTCSECGHYESCNCGGCCPPGTCCIVYPRTCCGSNHRCVTRPPGGCGAILQSCICC